jgi:hypothetical protein
MTAGRTTTAGVARMVEGVDISAKTMIARLSAAAIVALKDVMDARTKKAKTSEITIEATEDRCWMKAAIICGGRSGWTSDIGDTNADVGARLHARGFVAATL